MPVLIRNAVVAVLLCWSPLAASAQLPPGEVATLHGIRGYWWPLETADVLRREHLLVPELQAQLELEARKIAILEERLAAWKEAQLLERERAAALTELVQQLEVGRTQALTQAAKAEESLRAWYRNPALWAGAGALVATGVLAAALGLSQ